LLLLFYLEIYCKLIIYFVLLEDEGEICNHFSCCCCCFGISWCALHTFIYIYIPVIYLYTSYMCYKKKPIFYNYFFFFSKIQNEIMKEIFFHFWKFYEKTPKLIYDTNFGFLLLCKKNFINSSSLCIYIYMVYVKYRSNSFSLIFGDKIKNAKKKKKKLRNLALKWANGFLCFLLFFLILKNSYFAFIFFVFSLWPICFLKNFFNKNKNKKRSETDTATSYYFLSLS